MEILHLDDRLLHGRILHGWGARLEVRRYVLAAPALADPQHRALYAAGAESQGCELLSIDPEDCQAELPEALAGDFWLADAPVTALTLWGRGLRFERLCLIGLRDVGGEFLGGELRAGTANRAALDELLRLGVLLEARAFPHHEGRRLELS